MPFDDILDVLQNADANIKNVALEEPTLYTCIMTADGTEYPIASAANPGTMSAAAMNNYMELVARNVLAGRVELFNYDKEFATAINEKRAAGYDLIYPANIADNPIVKLEPRLTIYQDAEKLTLGTNQVVQFRAPNFKTEVTYPAYVNYFIKLNKTTEKYAIPATFQTLGSFMTTTRTVTGQNGAVYSYKADNFLQFMSNRDPSSSYMVKTTSANAASY